MRERTHTGLKATRTGRKRRRRGRDTGGARRGPKSPASFTAAEARAISAKAELVFSDHLAAEPGPHRAQKLAFSSYRRSPLPVPSRAALINIRATRNASTVHRAGSGSNDINAAEGSRNAKVEIELMLRANRLTNRVVQEYIRDNVNMHLVDNVRNAHGDNQSCSHCE